ncbi:MAG: hypothetical protein OXR68_00045, partial [Alphaproteobacteria bacterium]|nr:hypothetical protein [Alphaproteobacteria bacterium]
MSFASWPFIAFFILLMVTWSITPRLLSRQTLLLLASYGFYAFVGWQYVWLLATVSIFGWGAGKV